MTRPIQTNRCTNTVARAFGIEANTTLVHAYDLTDELREAGFTVEKIKTQIPHDTVKCNKEESEEQLDHWECRFYDDRKMVDVLADWTEGENWILFNPGHVQAVLADGSIVDTNWNPKVFGIAELIGHIRSAKTNYIKPTSLCQFTEQGHGG